MPKTTSIADFNRRTAEVADELSLSGEPLYLTRNGKAFLAVMDAEAFDNAMSLREETKRREIRVCSGILKGLEDIQNDRVSDAESGLAELRAEKGWQ